MPAIDLVERDSCGPRELEARVDELLATRGERLIVDVGGGCVDANLLRLLVVADRTLSARGGRLVVLCDRGAAHEALQASGLDLYLSVVDTLVDALDLLDPLPGSAAPEAECSNRPRLSE